MNMNNQKGFANIVLIVVIVAIVAVVGYFAFVKKSEPVGQQTTPPANNTVPQNPPTTIPQLTKAQVLNGYDQCGVQFNNGKFDIGYDKYIQLERTCSAAASFASMSADEIVVADLDGDGINEVLAPVGIVRASSGGALYVFKNVNGTARVIDSVIIGKENIKIVSVNKDTIVGKTDGAMSYTPTTQTYKFVNGKLIRQ